MSTAPPSVRLEIRRSAVLDHFLALQRETGGRFAQETTCLPWPLDVETAGFRDGITAWASAGLNELPAWVAEAGDVEDFRLLGGDDARAHGTELIAAALEHSWAPIDAALSDLDRLRVDADAELRELAADRGLIDGFLDGLGLGAREVHLDLYPVVLAAHYPGVGFLAEGDRLTGAYLDVGRFRGALRADVLLSVVAWAAAGWRPDIVLPTDQGGGGPHPRVRALAAKCMVELSTEHAVRTRDEHHRGALDLLGTAWRHPRVAAAVERAWRPTLTGSTTREHGLRDLHDQLASYDDDWWLLDLDGASIAADFYLLEHLATRDPAAARLFARWMPGLAGYLAGQIDVIIGTELGHFERARGEGTVFDFVAEVNAGDSRAGWYDARRRLGQRRGLEMARRVFDELGAAYGGEAWDQPTALLLAYVAHEIPPTVFADQCFTLEHNSGALFDKYWDTGSLQEVLDAHAAGDVDVLAGFASAQVQELWRSSRGGPAGPGEDAVDGPGGVVAASDRNATAPFPESPGRAAGGTVGCGRSGALAARTRGSTAPAAPPAASRSRELPSSLTLETTLGEIAVRLRGSEAPVNVAAVVDLATGARAWTDPTTWERRAGPFYTGTTFYRTVADEMILAGDRTGTGEHGPGFRLVDEDLGGGGFDVPYGVGMNNHGPETAGSQFFVAIPPRPDLDRRHTAIGVVEDARSRGVVDAVSRSEAPVLITGVRLG